MQIGDNLSWREIAIRMAQKYVPLSPLEQFPNGEEAGWVGVALIVLTHACILILID